MPLLMVIACNHACLGQNATQFWLFDLTGMKSYRTSSCFVVLVQICSFIEGYAYILLQCTYSHTCTFMCNYMISTCCNVKTNSIYNVNMKLFMYIRNENFRKKSIFICTKICEIPLMNIRNAVHAFHYTPTLILSWCSKHCNTICVICTN